MFQIKIFLLTYFIKRCIIIVGKNFFSIQPYTPILKWETTPTETKTKNERRNKNGRI